jgi:hypothetical protein
VATHNPPPLGATSVTVYVPEDRLGKQYFPSEPVYVVALADPERTTFQPVTTWRQLRSARNHYFQRRGHAHEARKSLGLRTEAFRVLKQLTFDLWTVAGTSKPLVEVVERSRQVASGRRWQRTCTNWRDDEAAN